MNAKKWTVLAALALTAGAASAGGFGNGGFESGTTAGWTTGGGHRGSVDNTHLAPALFLPGGALNGDAGVRGAVVDSSYVDPNIGAALGATVYAGRYAYRAEDTTIGGYATAISQKVTHYTDPNVFFAWKAVLENGGHSAPESALMQVTLTDDTTGELLIGRSYNAGEGGVGVDTRFASLGNLFYTPSWQIEQLSIDSARMGHDFTLSLLAADCQPTAHTGYAYLDGFGGVTPSVPEPEGCALLLAGLGLLGLVKCRKSRA